MNETANILRRARDLIADPSRWTQWAMARDANNHDVAHISAAEPVKFCALGAWRKIMGIGLFDVEPPITDYLYAAAYELFNTCPESVNDDQGHSAVMRMYARAIEMAEHSSPLSFPPAEEPLT
jgi:hypothetical protein